MRLTINIRGCSAALLDSLSFQQALMVGGIGRHSTVNNCRSKSRASASKWIFETFTIYVLKLDHINSLKQEFNVEFAHLNPLNHDNPYPSCQISAKKKWARQKLMRNSMRWTRKILQVKHMTQKTILRGHASWALAQTIFKKGKNKIKSLKKLGIKLGRFNRVNRSIEL